MKQFKYYLKQVIYSLAEASSGLKRASMEMKDEEKYDSLVREIDNLRDIIEKELHKKHDLPGECY